MEHEKKIEVLPAGSVFTLRNAILLYGSPATRGCSDQGIAYASTHDIEINDGKLSIGAGIPVTTSALRRMFSELNPEKRIRPQFLNGDVLAVAPETLVWWSPPAPRTVFFNCQELGGKVSATVPLPGLVFAVIRKDWRVFALSGKSRPVPETQLMRSPFFNVWAGGRICSGNVEMPKGKKSADPGEWEAKFFDSWFTHSNVHAPQKLVAHAGGAYAFWAAMLRGGYKQFPWKMLVEESWQNKKVTLADLISASSRELS